MSIPAKAFALAILSAVASASPAVAAAEAKTRLVSCGAGNCLLVTGHRADAASTVTINGHTVSANGARKWRVSVPVDTVRVWSAPYARKITVAVTETGTRAIASQEVDLPIGLLGHAERLAMLTVTAH